MEGGAEVTKNLRIWDAVKGTDPRHTKQVSIGSRKFTAIDAYYQIQNATELFGPLGIGWWFDYETEVHDGLFVVFLALYYHEPADPADGGAGVLEAPELRPVRAIGSAPLRTGKQDSLDKDAPKKALTDALTKALSYLGFNADVFLGLFDDNKYVQEQLREARGKDAAGAPQKPQERRQAEPARQSSPPAEPKAAAPGPVSGSENLQEAIDLVKQYPDRIRDQATLKVAPGGFPAWFDERIGFGQKADERWIYTIQGAEDGRRMGWLHWLVSSALEDPPTSDERKVRLCRAIALIHWRNTHGAPSSF